MKIDAKKFYGRRHPLRHIKQNLVKHIDREYENEAENKRNDLIVR